MKKPTIKRFQRRMQPSTDVIRDRLSQIEGATLRHAHKFIVRRWKNLREVRRYAFAWLGFVGILVVGALWHTTDSQKLYSVSAPAEGGTYTEAVAGSLDNMNPIFASAPAERSVARLVFGTILRYDQRNQLVGDLAESWGVDETGRVYTVKLRSDIRWHDGVAITAKDAVYTFNMIKNADTRSPLYTSWQHIAVAATDEKTIVFTLPAPYAPFPNALVIGLLPEHVLGSVSPIQLRNVQFNQTPTVGSGPFVFKDKRQADRDGNHVWARLSANPYYYRGKPKLSGFTLHAFKDEDDLLRSIKEREVGALNDTTIFDSVQLLQGEKRINSTVAPLQNGVYAFFKTTHPIFQDVKVRKALELVTPRDQIVQLFQHKVRPLHGPLLPGQLGYSDTQKAGDFDKNRAAQLLDEAGWKLDDKGKRIKDGQPLRFSMAAVNSSDYTKVTDALVQSWSSLGITIDTQIVNAEEFQQAIVLPHAYDTLVYELAIGLDPDVYAYWHSSQAGQRGLNLSEYQSAKVDDALDSARVRLEPALREAKYKFFAQQWLQDVPAVGLYQPTLLYTTNPIVTAFKERPLVEPVDRYEDVIYWSADREMMKGTR